MCVWIHYFLIVSLVHEKKQIFIKLIVLFLFADILVGVQYLHSGDMMWGLLTLGFVLAPSLVIQLFSARWYMADGKMKGCHTWTVHLCQLQPLER